MSSFQELRVPVATKKLEERILFKLQLETDSNLYFCVHFFFLYKLTNGKFSFLTQSILPVTTLTTGDAVQLHLTPPP